MHDLLTLPKTPSMTAKQILAKAKWLKKHYPTPARNFLGLDRKDPKVVLYAVQHALTKWRGLRKTGPAPIPVDNTTCSLCWLYCKRAVTHVSCSRGLVCRPVGVSCKECVLTKALGRPCTETAESPGTYSLSPYGTWAVDDDPEPMIKALEEAETLAQLWVTQGRTT